MISKLFWHRKTLTVSEEGLIRFHVNKCSYEFQIYDEKTFFEFQREKVKVYYDTRKMSEVHLFDCNNRFIGVIEPRLIFDGDNFEVITKHRGLRSGINKHVKEKKKQWATMSKSRSDSRKRNSILNTQFHDSRIEDATNQHDKDLYLKLNGVKYSSMPQML